MNNKAQIVFEKIAKDFVDYADAPLLGAGIGATAGLSHTTFKKSLKEPVKVKGREITKFINKLKPGDVIMSGHYNLRANRSQALQALLNRNEPYYHAGVYIGKGKTLELDPTDKGKAKNLKSRTYSVRTWAKDDPMIALRPKISKKEHKVYLKKVKKDWPSYRYSKAQGLKAFIINPLQKAKILPKNSFYCNKEVCTTAVSKALPQRLFKVNKSVTMPKDFLKNKNFTEVGRLLKARTHLPASNPNLLKYVAAPAAAGLAIGAALEVF